MSQTITKYIHPNVTVTINDNTVFTDITSTVVDDNVKMLSIFRSSMGPDNVILKFSDLTEFHSTYGLSDFSKYGQPLMMAIGALKSKVATVSCMRVMPDDAYAANSVLLAMYKADATAGKFMVKFKSVYIPKTSYTDPTAYSTSKAFKASLKLSAEALKSTAVDAEGYMTLPICTFRSFGRGIYGDGYRWRITRNYEFENEYGMKMYSFETLSTLQGLASVAESVGSIVTDDTNPSSVLINDVMDDQDIGSIPNDIQVFEDNIEELYDAFVAFEGTLPVDSQDILPGLKQFDPFFGLQMGEIGELKNYEVEVLGDGVITVDNPQGTTYAGGDDGIFADANPTTVYNAEILAYNNAFSGVYDRSILSTKRVPADVLLDANYPDEVKRTLFELAALRETCLCYMDSGVEVKLSTIQNVINKYVDFNERFIAKEFQHYITRDPDTNKKCTVSTTYFFAQQLPIHFKTNGSHIPFVKANARLYGHVKDSLEPSIDEIDRDLKDTLYKNRINYFETVAENRYERGCQNTAQIADSDLLEENNVNTLYTLKRNLEADLWNDIYDFTSIEDRVRFTEKETAKYANWVGRQLQSFKIQFTQSDFQRERSILYCQVDIQFRNLVKRISTVINVNRRTE